MDSNELLAFRERVSEKAPLVLNITNYVAMNINANALLAVGASPVMSFYPKEMRDMVEICSSVCVNIGCLDAQQETAIREALPAAVQFAKPWVLDPVGVGASHARLQFVDELVADFRPAVIRCNASEILTIAGAVQITPSRGLDAAPGLDDEMVVQAARMVAAKYKTVVSVSGAVDYITDGETVNSVSLGSPLMPKVTAMGCTASAITAAFVATEPGNPLHAAYAAMLTMGYCGQKAAEKAGGPGSFVPLFIDQLYNR